MSNEEDRELPFLKQIIEKNQAEEHKTVPPPEINDILYGEPQKVEAPSKPSQTELAAKRAQYAEQKKKKYQQEPYGGLAVQSNIKDINTVKPSNEVPIAKEEVKSNEEVNVATSKPIDLTSFDQSAEQKKPIVPALARSQVTTEVFYCYELKYRE
jgi:hypothetical protein